MLHVPIMVKSALNQRERTMNKRINAYLASKVGAGYTDHFIDSDDYNDIYQSALAVVNMGETYRCGGKSISAEDVRVELAENQGIDRYNVYIGDILDLAQNDTIACQTLTKRMLLDTAFDMIFEVETENE